MVTSTHKPLIMGNWKMHGDRDFATQLTTSLSNEISALEGKCDAVICPPTIWLEAVANTLGSTIMLGAQDCAITSEGAHTGQIGPQMLKNVGCDYVIVGHSERRAEYFENDALVQQKAQAALDAGLTPVVCVGETLEDRQAGKAISVVEAQIKGSVPQDATGCVIAYEPVWAIGTGEVPTLEDIEAMHSAIHTCLKAEKEGDTSLRVLYGGSVKPNNAKDILRIEGVNGALVGGASLKAESFMAICEAV